MSHCSSSALRPTPAVRTMQPMPSGGAESSSDWRTMSRSSPSMRRETPPAPRVVRHQHDEAAGEADIRGERRALGAALLLLYLDDDLLAFAQNVADVHAVALLGLATKYSLEISFSGRKPWRADAVIDEARLEPRFDPRDAALVDVGFRCSLEGTSMSRS